MLIMKSINMSQEIIKYLIFFILMVSGLFYLILILWLPNHVKQMQKTVECGVEAKIIPGCASLIDAVTALTTSLTTAFSILSAITIAFFVFPPSDIINLKPILSGVITLVIFLIGMMWTLRLSLKRSLTSIAPSLNEVLWSLRLLLLGLSFTMFTISLRIYFWV